MAKFLDQAGLAILWAQIKGLIPEGTIVTETELVEILSKYVTTNTLNETVEALLEMKAKRTALILDRGNGLFQEGIVPEDQQQRVEELKSLDYSEVSWLFDLLDHEFQELKEDLEALSLQYVLCHKEAFM